MFKMTLYTQESKWVPANCWGNLTNCGELTSVPSRGVEILLAASCYRNAMSQATPRLQYFLFEGGIVIFLSEKEREEEEEDA